MNPFLVLDLPANTTDEEVRAAYQKLLRRFPPEHRPAQFQVIQEAYQLLRTGRERCRWRLLHLEGPHCGPLEALEEFARLPGRAKPPGAPALREFMRSCAAAAKREQAPSPKPAAKS